MKNEKGVAPDSTLIYSQLQAEFVKRLWHILVHSLLL